MDCASRCDPVSSPAKPGGQSVTIFNSLMPCAIDGLGKLPTAATVAAVPSNILRRRICIVLLP